MICGTCEQKNSIEKDSETIWGFNPFMYDTFRSLKKAFYFFYIKMKPNFYKKLNEEGYTYSQWYIYYLSNNMYKYKKLHKQIVWLFQVMSEYDFFKHFIKLGKFEDHKHNTLHHYLKYMTNMGNLQYLILNLLINNGLNMTDEDNEGYNGYDYLNNKLLSDEDKLEKNILTRKYKILEKEFDNIVLLKIGDKMKKCDICLDFIEKYEDIKLYKQYIYKKDDKEDNEENGDKEDNEDNEKNEKNEKNVKYIKHLIEKIIEYRQNCINIHKKYIKCSDSIERHQYVVDIYRELI